jgi:hypothetical protein
MTLHLTLPAPLEERLRQEAERQGLAPDTVTLQILDQHLPKPLDDRRAAAIAMLHRWMEENAALSDEEFAENEKVLRMIDEDRPSYRKLFTDILKEKQK